MTSKRVEASDAASDAAGGSAGGSAGAELIVERALVGALSAFGELTGGSIVQDDEATRISSGTGFAAFNHVIGVHLRTADPDRRIAGILVGFASPAVALTWWVGPNDVPADLADRLARLGLEPDEPEFAMVLDLASTLPPMDGPSGVTLEPVRDGATLDAWLSVMAAAYAWPDPAGKSALLRAMYARELDRADPPASHHFLVRLEGRPAASSSLFVGGGQAFITNIGTIPGARGRGLGRLATLATLDLARSTGYSEAVLAASVDGRGLYRRLGFRDCGRFDRFVAPVDLIVGLAASPGAWQPA